MLTPEQLVSREVIYCVSSLVSVLANNAGGDCGIARDLNQLTEQASELCIPIDDYEEAAIQAGYNLNAQGNWQKQCDRPGPEFDRWYPSAQHVCEAHDIEPYQREVFEHWIVSKYLGEALEAQGECVDFDFQDLVVWARTTTGQGIASDYVIGQIVAAINEAK